MNIKKFDRLSTLTTEEIGRQFQILFNDFEINKNVVLIEDSTYIFAESFRFGLYYVYREIHDQALSIEKCLEVWKELKKVNTPDRCHKRLKEILGEYFTTVPTTFTKESKAILIPETLKVIKHIVLELTDSEINEEFSNSSSFQEWIKNYYTFIEDGTLYSGFRGKSLTGPGDSIYLHKNSFWKVVDTIGYEKAILSHCHTVIHEIMHLHSHLGEGVNTWMSLSDLTGTNNVQQKLDEGFTEIFSRTIIYRMQRVPNVPEVPEVFFQGKPDNILPVYEGLKNIACDIAKDVGLDVLARGYFLGEWDEILQKMKSIQKYNNPDLWKHVNNISHTANIFIEQDDEVEYLVKFGLTTMAKPSDIHKSVINNNYNDIQLRALYPFVMKTTNGGEKIITI